LQYETRVHSWCARCGKAATARALLDRVGGRLFDNHAAIDVARTVFEFGTPEFWELVQATRVLVLESASKRDLPLLVMTFVYVDPADLPTFEQFEAIVQRGGDQLLPVFLECSVDEIVRRVGNNDRVMKNKMTSEKNARDFHGQIQGWTGSTAQLPRPQ
jgi:hypothetical protein